MSRHHGDIRGEAIACGGLGNAAQGAGDFAAARLWLELCLPLFEQAGDQQRAAFTLGNLANLATSQEDYLAACQWHRDAINLFRLLGDSHNLALGLNNLVNTLLEAGSKTAAREMIEESLAVCIETNNTRAFAHAISLSVILWESMKLPDRAARLMGFCDALRKRAQLAPPSQVAQAFDDLAKRLRDELGPEHFDAMYHAEQNAGWEQIAILAIGSEGDIA